MRKNKYIIPIALLIICLAAPGAAQIPLEKLDFGLKVGVGIGGVVNHTGDVESRMGALVGGLLIYKHNRLFSIQIELLYSSKGYKVIDVIERDTLGNIAGQSDLEFIFNYFEMPLLAKITPPVAGKYHPYIIAGGFVAYGIDNKMRVLERIPFDFDIGNANDIDYGLITGVGLDMKSGNGRVFIEARYDMSFAKAVKNEKQKLRMLAFQIGYSW